MCFKRVFKGVLETWRCVKRVYKAEKMIVCSNEYIYMYA